MDVKAAQRLQLSAVVQPERFGRRPPFSTCRLGVSREPQSLRVFVSPMMMRRRTTALEVSSSYDNISGFHSNQSPHYFFFLFWCCWISFLLLSTRFCCWRVILPFLLFNFAERIVSSELSVFQTKWRIGNWVKKCKLSMNRKQRSVLFVCHIVYLPPKVPDK